MAKHHHLCAICPTWAQPMVADELLAHGFRSIQVGRGGVYFKGHVGRANRVLSCPTRILWVQGRFKAHTFDELVSGIQQLDLSSFAGFEIHAACSRSALYHSEAVAARIRPLLPEGKTGLYVRIHKDIATVSVDATGEALYRRGWRLENGPAPMRETVASCLLYAAQWRLDEAVCDPMCGSGTFVIEAGTRATGLAPGRLRGFECDAWSGPGRELSPRVRQAPCVGNDHNKTVLSGARRNANRAGVSVAFIEGDASELDAPAMRGLLVCNPPYGVRLSQGCVYETLGRLLIGAFRHWRAAIVCPSEQEIRKIGTKPVSRLHFTQGGLPLIFAQFEPRP